MTHTPHIAIIGAAGWAGRQVPMVCLNPPIGAVYEADAPPTGIGAESKHTDAAWKFIEYASGVSSGRRSTRTACCSAADLEAVRLHKQTRRGSHFLNRQADPQFHTSMRLQFYPVVGY